MTTIENYQPQKAIIYCRVSDKKQKVKGSGLDSQEHRCREYAAERGYDVVAVFPDDISGGGDFMKRPGMVALLAYLDAFPSESFIVVFDDLKRYARDAEFHLKLKREMKARNARRECLNFKFEDTPEGKFIETILAAQSELEREQNGRQVRQKMRARLEQGYWTFPVPPGYCYVKSKRGGKELVRNEPIASIIQEAMEGFASGRFETQVEVKRFLESRPEFPKDRDNYVHPSRVTELFERPLYAGYVHYPEWDVHMVPGKHEPLVDFETFEKIQHRRAEGAKAPARKDLNADFPLRGFVLCCDCHKPLTAAWSAGKQKKYPYYFCGTKGCESYRKSIPRHEIEDDFEAVLRRLQPTRGLYEVARAMFKDAWDQRLMQAQDIATAFQNEAQKLERQIDGLLDRIVETANPSIVAAYEKRIAKLEHQKRLALSKTAKSQKPQHTFQELFEHAMGFVSNPCKLWDSGELRLKRLVLRLAFSERLAYRRYEGYRTPKTALPFNILGDFCMQKGKMVGPEGLEPPTKRL